MKILLLGYGKMGKAIEAIAVKKGHEIVGKINNDNIADLEDYNGSNTDVAIEFSQPGAAYDNLEYCLENDIPVICGTTGWLDNKPEIERLCESNKGTFFYASNYSIGVNIFFKVNEYLAELMEEYSEYNVGIEEIHHTEKKDIPSGTAISIAEGIIANNDKVKAWTLDESENESEVKINSIRKDKVPGTHTVTYKSAIDNIEIKHTAHSREGFALGAVLVAEWIKDKKGVLSMDDFLDI
ncbi:4-hydroxy-tetrahydrodipicolinate reductase [Fulvivirga sediminis]|uniref:4-hydroxy-tetrahydrodipicolinate reductase n=1 Tax=Fulvivirga sediminis TaxID=2803949 RepID=A0A937K0F4_9BACT|nr:4-hydroxy-tetrahydrodipicolinate reductase [Fulvivirga sediminis]MBL3657594.1 4-hydroxy-tetrahydrodipicolinate reductase [Fulvivirga sediminis]